MVAVSSAPERPADLSLTTSDIFGAAPKRWARELTGHTSFALTASDIDGAAPVKPRVSGRNPVDPEYPPLRPTWREDGRINQSALLKAPDRQVHVRETNYVVDGPTPLYPGTAREPLPPVEGSSARRAIPIKASSRHDPLDVRDINKVRSPVQSILRDPLNPEYVYDMAGCGPISTARHVQPLTREAEVRRKSGGRATAGPGDGSLRASDIPGAQADTVGAKTKNRATRESILDISDVDGSWPGTRGDGFTLYRRADYEKLTGRRRVAMNAPGVPAPPTKESNRLCDISGTNPGSAYGIPIYRPTAANHKARMKFIIDNGRLPDADEPYPRRQSGPP